MDTQQQNKIKQMEILKDTKITENEKISKDQQTALNNLEAKFIAMKNKTIEQNNDLVNKSKVIAKLKEEFINLNENYRILLQEVENNKQLIESKNNEIKQLALKLKDTEGCKTCAKFEATCKEFVRFG